MSRPRKPEDPELWPETCARCAGHYQIAARWPDGGICGYCYQQAKRSRGTCGCGHTGVLPGRIDGAPACRSCSGITLNVDCRACGAEDELYSAGRCLACTLATTVDRLLAHPETGAITPALVPLAEALKTMDRANSGLTWIRLKHVTAFLQHLAATSSVTHQGLDALPASRTREFVRGLLIEHGVLEPRDHYRAWFDQWARQVPDRLTNPTHREVIRRYIRWNHQRRMRQLDPVPQGTFLRSKQAITVAVELLSWLTDHDIDLATLGQDHLDVWQATGPSTRLMADRFLAWAIRTRLVSSELKIQRHRRGTSPRMNARDQDQALHRVIHTQELTPRDRAAAILVLVLGKQIQDVVTLTWGQVTVTPELVTLRIGAIDMALPAPLDQPWRQLAAHPGHARTAAHPNSNWVFRGQFPGRHLDAAHLRQRLQCVFSTRAARLGTLHELTKDTPVAILAEALGYSPATIEHHATDSTTNYARYIDAIRTTTHTAVGSRVRPAAGS